MSQKSQIVHRNVSYDAHNQARIRIFGQYGRDVVRLLQNSTCQQWWEKQGQRAHTRFTGGLPRRIRNLSIGIPATERSTQVNADTGIVFRESYKEFVIPAGKPLVLDAAFSTEAAGYLHRCRLAGSLIPQAGKDYEAQYSRNHTGCQIKIVEVLPQTVGEVHPTRASEIQYCPAPKVSY